MPRALLYTSASMRLRDAVKHGIAPLTYTLFKMLGEKLNKDDFEGPAALAADIAATGTLLVNTAYWFKEEYKTLRVNAEAAVKAELGKDELSFRDFWNSDNLIVRKEARDMLYFTGLRVATNVADVAYTYGLSKIPGVKHFQKVQGDPKHAEGREFNPTWAAMGGYWFAETLPATSAHYDLVHLGDKQKTDSDFSFNDVWAVMQRSRESAKPPKPHYSDTEKALLRPAVEYLLTLFNTPHHTVNDAGETVLNPIESPSGKLIYRAEPMKIVHLTYLIGCERLTAHDEKGNLLPPAEALRRNVAEIDRLAEMGLEGIMRETAAARGNSVSGKQGKPGDDRSGDRGGPSTPVIPSDISDKAPAITEQAMSDAADQRLNTTFTDAGAVQGMTMH